MESLHEKILVEVEAYVAETEKFNGRGIKASAARARKALGNLTRLAKDRRKEIQETKNNMC